MLGIYFVVDGLALVNQLVCILLEAINIRSSIFVKLIRIVAILRLIRIFRLPSLNKGIPVHLCLIIKIISRFC